MKKITIDYIIGLASFLDEQKIPFETDVENDVIIILYNEDKDLFRIGFEFGKFYAITD